MSAALVGKKPEQSARSRQRSTVEPEAEGQEDLEVRCNSKSQLGLRMRYGSAEMTITRAQLPLPSRGSSRHE
jgi:hypothetical protein